VVKILWAYHASGRPRNKGETKKKKKQKVPTYFDKAHLASV